MNSFGWLKIWIQIKTKPSLPISLQTGLFFCLTARQDLPAKTHQPEWNTIRFFRNFPLVKLENEHVLLLEGDKSGGSCASNFLNQPFFLEKL